MKVYSKKDLTYKNGLLVTADGDVVCLDNEVVDMANELETRIQKAAYLGSQPEATKAPSLNGFERKTETVVSAFVKDTPLMDQKVKDTLALMEELDDAMVTDKLNEQIKNLTPLVYFVKEDDVLSVEHATPHRFDVPVMGNPLEWDEDKLMQFIAMSNGLSIVDDEVAVETTEE